MNKFFVRLGRLEIIVFVSGAVVMVLELVASRLLAPYLGTSIYVWASLIGVILGALTIGYYLGGKFSLIKPQLSFLASVLLFSGLTIFLIALVKMPVLSVCMAFGVKAGSVAAALTLFALPSLLLGMVSPYAIRLKIENIEQSGGVAGNLYALSTVGSIFGTFLAGFVLIPVFGSGQILFGLSLALIIASLLGGKRWLKIAVILAIILVWFLDAQAGLAYVYETDSAYNHIRVADKTEKNFGQSVRVLYLATEAHSIIYKDSDELFSAYSQLYGLDTLFKPEIKKGLTLGGGAYIWPLNFLKQFPDGEMTVVEIDPKVTATAQKYFRLKPDSRLKIIHEDGRIFLNHNSEKFDVIYGDAFASYFSIPFQLTTHEAMGKIYQSLADDGVFILNVISALEGEKSLLFKAEYKTLSSVFPQLYVFPAYYYNGDNLNLHQNIIIVASKDAKRLNREELLSRATARQKELLERFWEKEIELAPGTRILTDDFAPVDYYISKLL